MASKTLWDIVSENVNGETDFSLAHKRLNTPRLELLPPEFLVRPSYIPPRVATVEPVEPPTNPLLTGNLPSRSWGEAIVDPLGSLGKGTLQFGKSLVDAVSPGSGLSTSLGDSISSINDLQSSRWKAQNARDEAAMKAEDSQLGKFALGAKQAISNPDKLIGMVGQIAPTIATGVLGLGAKAMLGVQAAMGSMQGAGAVRGGIHENVMTAPLDDLNKSAEFITLSQSHDEPTARKLLADKAASLQESGDLVALATLVGGASGIIGLGSSLARTTGGVAVKQTGKTAAKTIAKEVATEVPEEGGQQYGSNLGASRTGMKIDLSKGVAESMGGALVMGAAGGGIGARIEHVAALNSPTPSAGNTPVTGAVNSTNIQQSAAQNYRNTIDNPVLDEQGNVDQTAVKQAREQFINTFDDPVIAQAELAKIDGELNGSGTTTETSGGSVSANDTGTTNRSAQGDQGVDASTRSAQSIIEAVRRVADEPSGLSGTTREAQSGEGSGNGASPGVVTPGVAGLSNQQKLGGQGVADSTVSGTTNASTASSPVVNQLTPAEKIKYVRSREQSRTAPNAGTASSPVVNKLTPVEKIEYVRAREQSRTAPNAGTASSSVIDQLTPAEKIEYIRARQKSRNTSTENPVDTVRNIRRTFMDRSADARESQRLQQSLERVGGENPVDAVKRAVAYKGTQADVDAAGDAVVRNFLSTLEGTPSQSVKAEHDTARNQVITTALQDSIDAGFKYPDTVIDKLNHSFGRTDQAVLTVQERARVKEIIDRARAINDELDDYENELRIDKNTDNSEIEQALNKGKKNANPSGTKTREPLPKGKENADTSRNVVNPEHRDSGGNTGQEAGVYASPPAQARVETPAQQNATRRLTKADDAGHLDVSEYSEVESLIAKGDLLSAMSKLNKYARENGGDVKYQLRDTPQTETAAFKKWFGDSKVVDAKGNPLLIYRGESSGEERNIYDTSTTRENGIFTTPNKEIARVYENGKEPRAFYVKADSLLDLTVDNHSNRMFVKEWASHFDEWVDRVSGEEIDPFDAVMDGRLFDYEGDWSGERWKSLQAEALSGHDAAYLNDYDNGIGIFPALVLSDKAQLKSATGNNGNFDGSNPDIRYSEKGAPHSSLPMVDEDFVNGTSSALDSIAKNKSNHPVHRELARTLSPLLRSTNIQLVPQIVTPNGDIALGSATADGLNIKISVDGGMNPTTVLHESVHAASERVIQMDKRERTPAQQAGVVELGKLQTAAKGMGLPMSTAASESLSEFAAEALTNVALVDAMSNQPWKVGTMWDKFKSTIMTMLGMKQPSTMTDAAKLALNAIFTPAPSDLKGNTSSVNYQLAAKQMPNAGLPTASRNYEANRLGDLARQFVDTANYLMLSLDKWAFTQDGNKDGDMVNLKLDFESAFYRSRNQKAVFTEGFKREMFDPLIAQVQGVAKAANDTVESIMEQVNNVAVARRVLEDSSSIARDQSALTGALIEQAQMVDALSQQERQAVGTGLVDAARAVARLTRSPSSLTVNDFNIIHGLVEKEAKSAASLIATSPNVAGIDIAVAFELATLSNLKLQPGDSVVASVPDLSQVANRLADLFGKDDSKVLKARVGRRAISQISQIDRWNKAQNRPTPDTDTDVRLPAGMTIAEAMSLIQVAGQHVATNQINQLADSIRDNFKTLADFAVHHGVTDAAGVAQSRIKRPNYVSFSANPDMESGDYVTHNNRAFLDHAEGSTSYMHGGNLNVFHTLVAKAEQSAHMASVQERNALAYKLATKNAPGFEVGSVDSPRNSRIQANIGGDKKFVTLNKKDWSSQAFFNMAGEPTPAGEAARTATRFFGSLVVHGVLLAAPVLAFKDMSTRMFNTLGADFERTTGKKLDTIRLNRKFATAMASPSVWQAAWAEATGKELPGIHKAFKDAGGLLTFMGDHPVTNTAIDKMFAEQGMIKSGWSALKGALHTWNQLFQSVPPIALYSTLLGEGVNPTKASAAVLSQMNLRKMGEMTKNLQTAYAFLNPSAQDAMLTKRTFIDSRGVLNKKAVTAAVAITSLSYIIYSMLRESDKDDPNLKGRKRIDSQLNSVVTNGFKVPLSDGYFTVPIGFGWPQTFLGVGVMAARANDGVVSTKDAVLDILKLAVKPGMLTGESSADLSKDPMLALTQIFMPDLVTGVVGVAQNKTPFGTPIDTASSLPNSPYLHKQGRPKTAEVWKDGADMVHSMLGIDTTPERLRAYVEAMTPGVLSGAIAHIDASDREAKGIKEKDGYGWIGKTIGASRVYMPTSDDQMLTRDFYSLKEIADDLGRKVKTEKTPMAWTNMSASARGVWLQNHGWEKKDADLLVAKFKFDSENAKLSNAYKGDREVSKVSGVYTYIDAQEDRRKGLQVEFLKSVTGYTQ